MATILFSLSDDDVERIANRVAHQIKRLLQEDRASSTQSVIEFEAPEPPHVTGCDAIPVIPVKVDNADVGYGQVKGVVMKRQENRLTTERLAYSIEEAAQMLGVHYFSVYRLVQRNKLRACRALSGKLLIPRTELLKLLKTE